MGKQSASEKKYFMLELEMIDEWDVKTFSIRDLIADMMISDAGYLVISEPALKALKDAGVELPPEKPLKVVKPKEE